MVSASSVFSGLSIAFILAMMILIQLDTPVEDCPYSKDVFGCAASEMYDPFIMSFGILGFIFLGLTMVFAVIGGDK